MIVAIVQRVGTHAESFSCLGARRNPRGSCFQGWAVGYAGHRTDSARVPSGVKAAPDEKGSACARVCASAWVQKRCAWFMLSRVQWTARGVSQARSRMACAAKLKRCRGPEPPRADMIVSHPTHRGSYTVQLTQTLGAHCSPLGVPACILLAKRTSQGRPEKHAPLGEAATGRRSVASLEMSRDSAARTVRILRRGRLDA
ncbi:hypothetical protein MTO96_023222 [Rhipicephalus appendiculatus]